MQLNSRKIKKKIVSYLQIDLKYSRGEFKIVVTNLLLKLLTGGD